MSKDRISLDVIHEASRVVETLRFNHQLLIEELGTIVAGQSEAMVWNIRKIVELEKLLKEAAGKVIAESMDAADEAHNNMMRAVFAVQGLAELFEETP